MNDGQRQTAMDMRVYCSNPHCQGRANYEEMGGWGVLLNLNHRVFEKEATALRQENPSLLSGRKKLY